MPSGSGAVIVVRVGRHLAGQLNPPITFDGVTERGHVRRCRVDIVKFHLCCHDAFLPRCPGCSEEAQRFAGISGVVRL
ncbi:MAG: hypothetical protein Ct9H300mP16_02860 [Pseudomonadota bacterium]|nr:MAG: hypothetical protein Ct9H300mP16_02860 [Pseudomonadota bacterium]